MARRVASHTLKPDSRSSPLRLQVRMFGRLEIERDERKVDRLAPCKVRELFCYLLLNRDRSHARETLAGMLWGESPSAQAKKYLRQALWQLQLGAGCRSELPADRTLLVDAGWVYLNSRGNIWLDVKQFEDAFTMVQKSPQLDDEQATALRQAVELYRGDLLEGWYHDWSLSERDRMQRMYFVMLDKLMAHCESTRQYDAGIEYGERLLRHDQARECTHQELMRLRCLTGDRAGALRQYERCTAALQADFGVAPSEATRELNERIRADRLNDPATVTRGASLTELRSVLDQLEQLSNALATVQQHVQARITAVEGSAGGTSPAAASSAGPR